MSISYDAAHSTQMSGDKKMNWTQIADNYWVSPQIDEQQVVEAAKQGYNVIVCNRPDGESDDQIPSHTIATAAKENGLEFIYLPMQGPNFTPDYVQQIQTLNTENKKVLAYCRSGNRSSILFNAAIG